MICLYSLIEDYLLAGSRLSVKSISGMTDPACSVTHALLYGYVDISDTILGNLARDAGPPGHRIDYLDYKTHQKNLEINPSYGIEYS